MAFVDSIDELSRMLKPIPEEFVADAAVALLLRRANQEVQVLLVKRVENPSDPWSGNIALPGGKRIAKDRDLKQTVTRETFEETHIDLQDQCRFLGVMDTQTSRPRPEMRILPFVILVEHEPVVSLNEELESFAWISLGKLVENKGRASFSFGEFPAYLLGDLIVWGLTYRILETLVSILASVKKA